MTNLLSLNDVTRTELVDLFNVAVQMRKIALSNNKKSPQLMGRAVCGVWKTPCISSTAFQLATAYLSGNFCPVFGSDDELEQCFAFANMGANVLVVNTQNENVLQHVARKVNVNVINGGSSQYDPIGVLADLMALYVKLDGLSNINVVAVGNRNVNKVAELGKCLQLFGSNLLWYLPAEDISTLRRGIVLDNLSAAIAGADAIVDLGLNAYASAEKYYGSSAGIPREMAEKAAINCPMLGCRTYSDGGAVKEYPNNAVSLRESCYVAVAMTVLYTMK